MYTAFTYKRHKKSKLVQIIYNSEQDGWVSEGTWADIHQISGFLVLINPLKSVPFLVTESYEILGEIIKEKYGIIPLWENEKDIL